MDNPRNVDRGLHFRIEAILKLEPTPEPVTFDAVLQPSTQEYAVEGQV
jgi:type VI secretion system protein ImpF